jgi:predicted nucleic-acid-binding protein
VRAIDTNVIVRFLVGDDAAMMSRACRLLEQADASKDPLVISTPVLLEMLWVLGSAYRFSRTSILDAVERLQALPAINFECRSLAAELVRQGRMSRLDLADILIGLHAKSLGADTILTFDRKAAQSDLFEEVP